MVDSGRIWSLGGLVSLAAAAIALVSCHGETPGGSASAATADVTTVTSALGGVTNANLQLQVSKNACAANLAQDYFKVTNASGAAVPLSTLSIRYWINDTTGTTIAPNVWYGGCVTSANGTCLHPVTGVTATATHFAPACGPDASHQASWEITISTTDTTPLAAGQIWSNVQTAVNLSTHANFAPGTTTWYSGCGTGQPYAADTRFALYKDGDLVNNQGVLVPLCRAPQIVQIQSYINGSFYADGDIVSSFTSVAGEQVDCINFLAQRSVKAWTAKGVTMPQTFPSMPPRPTNMPPPTAPSSQAFDGQLDASGRPRRCGSGTVPSHRPTVAEVQAAGGVAAFKQSLLRPVKVRGAQSDFEHDCWLNDAPGDGSPTGTQNAVDWEHAAGIQTSGFAPAGAPGYFGFHFVSPIYSPLVHAGPIHAPTIIDHAVSQFWVQTGGCETWYVAPDKTLPNPEVTNACQMGSTCTTCVGDACKGCAVQSLEVVIVTQNPTDYPPWAGTHLGVFIETDGYFYNFCYANGGSPCPLCPTALTTITPPGSDTPATEGTDCWVALPGAKFRADQLLLPNKPDGTNQYGVVPNELEVTVWNGSNAGAPGWWVYVTNDGAANPQPIGWYPPGTFNWPDGSPGPMSNGPATYLQSGGEVYNTWPGGQHTDTAMASDNPAQAGYRFAAYQRNMGYYDSGRAFHDASFNYIVAPASEGDNGIPGVCGLQSGGWTDASAEAGAYTLSTAVNPGGPDWGKFHYFGGGVITKEKFPTLPVLAADLHSCAGLSDGGVACWGDDGRGELGDNLAEGSKSVGVRVSGLSGVVAMSASANAVETCALLSTGTVDCWGGDQFGQIGIPTTPPVCPLFGAPCQPTPIAVPGLTNVTSVAVGADGACAVSGGTVKCWGRNDSGQLGNGGTSPSLTPVAVSGISDAFAVAAGDEFACAIRAGGSVSCWGMNASGQLGNGAVTGGSTPNPTPVAVSGISNTVSLSLGISHACALLAGGDVKCWGSNGFGQIGTAPGDTTACLFSPCVLTPVTVFSGATAVAAGGDYTCAIVGSDVKCLGRGRGGVLGNGSENDSNVPVVVSGLSGQGVSAISAGAEHACASLADGRVACWGDNINGDLGDGSCPDGRGCPNSTVPVFVKLP